MTPAPGIRMLTPEQRSEFQQLGMLRLPSAIDPEGVAHQCDSLWNTLAKHGVKRDAPETWTAERVTGIQEVSRSDAFAALGGAAVRSSLDDLLGPGGWEPPPRWGQPLVTFPTERKWELPHASWHLDAPASPSPPKVPGVLLFAYLAPVPERGGGTVMLAGSHRIVEKVCRRSRPCGRGTFCRCAQEVESRGTVAARAMVTR